MTPSMETWAPTMIFRMGHSPSSEPRTNGPFRADPFPQSEDIRVLTAA
jgi:hypothetical protein